MMCINIEAAKKTSGCGLAGVEKDNSSALYYSAGKIALYAIL